MAFNNNPQNVNQTQGLNGLTPQQYNTLINLLSQQPQASPTSPQFDPNYFSKLLGMQSQQVNPIQNVQPQQSQQQSVGNYQIVRIVEDPSRIGPQEVSMGMANIFPSSDKQRLYVKTWNNDGLIDTDIYVLQKGDDIKSNESEISDMYANLSKRVDNLETSLRRLQKQKSPPKSKPHAEKVDSNVDINEEENDNG